MPGPNDHLELSPSGLAFIQTNEGLRLNAYRDVRGIWTIGYGHTGPEVVTGLIWTAAQCALALEEDVLWAAKAVQDNVTVILNQNQFDALVSFVFNIGVGNFKGSTLLHVLNTGNYTGAALQFGKWIYAGTIISSGLINRRKKETLLFQTAA
jgi:lysozyme